MEGLYIINKLVESCQQSYEIATILYQFLRQWKWAQTLAQSTQQESVGVNSVPWQSDSTALTCNRLSLTLLVKSWWITSKKNEFLYLPVYWIDEAHIFKIKFLTTIQNFNHIFSWKESRVHKIWRLEKGIKKKNCSEIYYLNTITRNFGDRLPKVFTQL